MATIKERNGSYQITVSCGYDIQGKHLRETITFTPEPGLTPKKREKAVEDFARKFEEDVKNGIALDRRKITLKAFADRWLSEYAAQKLAPKTLEDYTNELNKRILPALGHMRLLVIAFLVSPMGLPMFAVWILSALQGISHFFKSI